MKSYSGLAQRYLKSQKKRTILTIIGVILSVSLLCAAGIMGESFRNMLGEKVKQQYGNYQVAFENIDQAQLDKLGKNIKLASVGWRVAAGTASLSQNRNLMITACNDLFLDVMYLKLSKGRLPEKENEIVLEQWMVENMKEKPDIGSTIKLDFTVGGSPEGQEKASREFKVTGIFKNTPVSQFTGVSMGVVSYQTAASILNSKSPNMDAAVTFKQGFPLQAAISETAEGIGVKKERIHQNTAVLSLDSQGSNKTINRSVFTVELIMILIILISTIAVIYNSFHISVLERIHQFGVLRSVGTTPRQIRTIVLFEACVLGVIGIPAGLLCGVVGVKTVMGIFTLWSSSFFGEIDVIIKPQTLLLTALLGFVTLLASAFGPAVTAGRVSPMEAILNRGARAKVKKKRRKHPVLMKLFKVQGVMAAENLVRNRKRFAVTVFSISIAIILFIFFSTFMNLMNMQVNTSFEKDFAVDRPFNSGMPGFTQKDYVEVASMKGVKKVYRIMEKNQMVLLDENQVTGQYKSALGDKVAAAMVSSGGIKYYGITSKFYGYRKQELDMYSPYLVKGGIDTAKMNRENGILVSQIVKVDGKDAVASSLKVGDVIMISDPKGNSEPVKLKVEGILDKVALAYTGGSAMFGMITTEEVFNKLTGLNEFSRFDIELARAADKNAIKEQLAEMASRVEDGRLLDYTEDSMKIVQMELGVILYGLVIVISLICALNIINTISTNLILRTREFGTLRAVGMTPGQITGMIRLEGVFYGLVGAFYGSIGGCLLSRLLYHYVNSIKGLTWHLPWQAVLEGCIAAMLIGLAASAAPLKRITRMNVVDSIRAEE